MRDQEPTKHRMSDAALVARMDTRGTTRDAVTTIDEESLPRPADRSQLQVRFMDDADKDKSLEDCDHESKHTVRRYPIPNTDDKTILPHPEIRIQDIYDEIVQMGPTQAPEHHEIKVPTIEQLKAIGKVHNWIRGHHGLQRTFDMLRRSLPEGTKWPYMRSHVKQFIDHCPACQKMRDVKTLISTNPFTTATYEPMHRINIDTIGPLPENIQGNKYIIVMIDCFSRFCELYPVPSTQAMDCARCLLNFIGRYGMPTSLI